MTFVFDKNYDNLGQVAEFLSTYLAVHAEIVAAGHYPYDDSFKGRIPGIEGPNEDTAIYLLQGTRHIMELNSRIDAAVADGFVAILAEEVTGTTKYTGIVHYGFYSGGTGWNEWANARLVRLTEQRSTMVLPKGHRTHGSLVYGKLLVKR